MELSSNDAMVHTIRLQMVVGGGEGKPAARESQGSATDPEPTV